MPGAVMDRPLFESLGIAALILAPLGWVGADMAPAAFGLAWAGLLVACAVPAAQKAPEVGGDRYRRFGYDAAWAARYVAGLGLVSLILLEFAWMTRARFGDGPSGVAFLVMVAALPFGSFLALRPVLHAWRSWRRRGAAEDLALRARLSGTLAATALGVTAVVAILLGPGVSAGLRGGLWQTPPGVPGWVLAVALPVSLGLAGTALLAALLAVVPLSALLRPLARRDVERLRGDASPADPQASGTTAEAAAPAGRQHEEALRFLLEEIREPVSAMRAYLERERDASAGRPTEPDPRRQQDHGTVDLGRLLQRLVAHQAPTSRAERQVEIVLQRLADGTPPVRGDEKTLERVLRQLIQDAVRHARPGGVVRLTLERHGDGETVALEFEGSADDAAGAPADPDTVATLERLGGSLSVSRQSEQGTVVSVQLPVSDPA